MANVFKITEWLHDGFRNILTSEGVKQVVEQAANDIQAKANANLTEPSTGYKVESIIGRYGGGRWISFVSATDFASAKAEWEDKVLSRAVSK